MDSVTRIKVLGRLAQSSTPAADEAIGRACEHAFATLNEGNGYGALEFGIEVLATVGFRRSKEAVSTLDNFIRSVETRHLMHSDEYTSLVEALSKYRNAYTLMSKSIKVLSGLRYLETPSVLETLLWASTHTEESVSKDALSALGDLAEYNLSVYYGQGAESGQGIGPAPQLSVIDTLEKRTDDELKSQLRGVLILLEGLLSTSMRSSRWSSTALKISRAATPADRGVLEVRQRSIRLLKRLYNIVGAKSLKLSIIGTMNAATRVESRAAVDKSYLDMVSENAQVVLTFFAQIAKEADLQIIQKLEHDSYWIYFHSPSEHVRSAALNVKAVIDSNEEYKIYKTLIGFEGIFGDWSNSHDETFELGSHDVRVKEARELASSIADEGLDIWRCRILTYAQTESNDLATFPVFYEFLTEVASFYPDFAFDLLNKDSEQLSRFLIPILRGLWDGAKRDELRLLIQRWVKGARPDEPSFLYSCVKLFLSTKHVDVGLLEELLEKATELKDVNALRQVVSVAIARSTVEEARDDLKVLFLCALSRLTALKDANWIREVWFRKEAQKIVAELSPIERVEILRNLRFLPQIDYQAEGVLAVIAETDPLDVVEFLCARVYGNNEHATALLEKEGLEYEELPFQFHTLQDRLSSCPKIVVQRVLDYYRMDSSLFIFRGAKLLQIIFPQFSEVLQVELVRLVREGGETELEFVAGILRAYNGETFIYPVARELIKRIPLGSTLVSEVEIALQSTGVVSGEYGMADAYETKRLEVLDWLQDPDDRIRVFASNYISDLQAMRDSEKERAEQSITLRKFTHGED